MNIDAAVFERLSAGRPKFRDHCLSSAQDIIVLARKYRSQHSLQFAPFVLVYALGQASRAMALFGTEEETRYLARGLEECSATWTIAQQLGGDSER